MTPPLLRVEGVRKRFRAGPVALDGLDLDVAAGEFVALLGGSGSGKSTLLRVVAGFEAVDAGRVLLDGRDLSGVPPHARPLNMMFQSYALFPHMNVADNVAYGLRRAGVGRAEAAARVDAMLSMLRLEAMRRREPATLSGGQRARVALARVLVKRPRLLLLDEPLSALDAGLRERLGFELRALCRSTGAAFVMVTHDQSEALSLADRVAVLEGGRIAQQGTPREVYARPATASLARFLGAANVLEVVPRADGALVSGSIVLRPGGPVPPGVAACALRPERVRLGEDFATENRAAGMIEDLAFRGGDSLALVRLDGGGTLRAALPQGAAAARGERVVLSWDAADVVPVPP